MAAARIIGVLGGMGPLATVDLYRKIIEATPATCDQDHLHVVIDGNPSVPDRTAALLHGGEDPTPLLLAGANRLASAGASFIVVPCNTAHAFLPKLIDKVPIPFLSMIEETANAASRQLESGSAVGILATAGTIAAGLYQAALRRRDLRSLVPTEEAQQRVTAGIRLVKQGDTGRAATEQVLVAANELIERGAQLLLAACTELPLILHQQDVSVPLIDPTQVLAETAVREALTPTVGEPTGREKATAYDVRA